MSDSHTKTNVKARHKANSSVNDMNSSFNSSVINMSTKSEKFTKYQLESDRKKNDVTEEVTHFLTFNNSENQCFTTDDNSGYYRDLSKNVSGPASRCLLAFFVPDNSAASQAVTMPSSTALRAYLSASRGHSLISIASHLLTDYDGLTLQTMTG